MPAISVVMTVYNAEKFLDGSVRSILEQTFTGFEFIIVDDGSTDRSVEIVRAYHDERIRFFPLAHAGRAAALNFAVSQAVAPFIAIMDADDISIPDRLELEYREIVKDQTIDIVGSSYQIIDEKGDLIREKHLPESHTAIVDLMAVQSAVSFPSALIRKSIMQDAGMFDEKLAASVDYDFWLRILDRAKFCNVSASLVQYRTSRTSISSRFRQVQAQNSYEKAMHYLEKKYLNADGVEAKAKITLQLGRREYYFGNMASARNHFSKLLWNRSAMFIAWRYYIPSLLGGRIFRALRSAGIADRIGSIFRKSSRNNDYFMP